MKWLLRSAVVIVAAGSPVSYASALSRAGGPLPVRVEPSRPMNSSFVTQPARNIQLAYQLPRTSASIGMHLTTGTLHPMNGTANHMSMSFSRTQMTYLPQNDNGPPKSKPTQQQKRKSWVKGNGGEPKLAKLKIDGVDGESADDKHKSEIHVNRHSRRRGNTSPNEHVQLNYNSVRY